MHVVHPREARGPVVGVRTPAPREGVDRQTEERERETDRGNDADELAPPEVESPKILHVRGDAQAGRERETKRGTDEHSFRRGNRHG